MMYMSDFTVKDIVITPIINPVSFFSPNRDLIMYDLFAFIDSIRKTIRTNQEFIHPKIF